MTEELYTAVKKMREAQKTYFRCRVSGNLNIAKSAERTVDELIKQIEFDKLPKQGDLF